MSGWGAQPASVPQAGIPPRGPDPEVQDGDDGDADVEGEEDLDWEQAQVRTPSSP